MQKFVKFNFVKTGLKSKSALAEIPRSGAVTMDNVIRTILGVHDMQ